MRQQTLAESAFEAYAKPTRRAAFLAVILALSCPAVALAVNGGTGSGATNGVCQQDTTSGSVACGNGSVANSFKSTAVGNGAQAAPAGAGGFDTAVGGDAQALNSGTAIGGLTVANQFGAVAVGLGSQATAASAVAIGGSTGNATQASGDFSTAIGTGAKALGNTASAMANGAQAAGIGSIAAGFNTNAAGHGDIAIGAEATTQVSPGAQTGGNIAIGASTNEAAGLGPGGTLATATGGNSVAIGTGSQSTGNNSVALGGGSTDGGLSYVLSVGSSSQTRKIINVTDGDVNATSTDAVNGSQLYGVQQTANTAITNAAAAQATANNSVQYSNGGTSVDLHTNGGAGTVIHNVAPGTQGTDAVNLNQLQAATRGLLGQANTYAASAAAAAMAQTAPQLRPNQTSALAAKIGYFDGQSAVGVGYAHVLRNNTLGTLSVSATMHGQIGASVGIQVGW